MSRPTARKREKKIARETKARARVAARAERLAAAREAASAPDARRNLHVERGRPVVVNDITPFARPKCGKCQGKGIAGMRSAGETTGAEPCSCATKRFFRDHPEIIVTSEGEAFWPATLECGCTTETVCPLHEKPNQSVGPGDLVAPEQIAGEG